MYTEHTLVYVYVYHVHVHVHLNVHVYVHVYMILIQYFNRTTSLRHHWNSHQQDFSPW